MCQLSWKVVKFSSHEVVKREVFFNTIVVLLQCSSLSVTSLVKVLFKVRNTSSFLEKSTRSSLSVGSCASRHVD